MKISKKILAATLVAPLFVSSFSSFAEEDKSTSVLIPFGMKYLFAGVELTKPQQGKVIDITHTNSQAKKAIDKDTLKKQENDVLKQLDDLSLKMQELVLAEDFNEAEIRELAKKMADVRVTKHVEKLREQHQLVSLLNAEQKELVKENIQAHAEKNKKAKAEG